MQGNPLLVALFMLAAPLSGCLTGGHDAETARSRPAEAGNRPSEPPGQAKKDDKIFSDTSVFPGQYRTKSGYSLTLQTGPYSVGDARVANVTIGRGGANVQIGYVLPVDPTGKTTEFPVIVQASVYYDALKPANLRTAYNSNPERSVDFLIDNYVPHGYAVALVPVRGAAGNGGCYEWWGDNERHDLQAALRWIVDQTWSKPALGLIGLSLAGAGAWMGAGFADLPIKTIVPVSSETDLYSWFVRNGTPSILAAPIGTTAFWGLYSVSPVTDKGRPGRDHAQIPNGAQCPALAHAIAANAYMTSTGAKDEFGYAQARDLRPHVEKNYTGSIFLITGLHDWLAHPHLVYPWANTLESKGIVVKHLLGQWRHRMPDDDNGGPFFQPTRRVDFAEILLHWWDYWLKGDKKQDLGPRVQVADNQNRWRNEDDWPPADAARTNYYAFATGLGTAPGAQDTKPLTPDPRRSVVGTSGSGDPKADCPGCAFYQTAPLASELRISGIPGLRAEVTPLGPGGVITAYVYSLLDGKATRLGWATMDLRFADGGTSPDIVVPGQRMKIRLEFEPLDAVVPAGAELLLEIGQGGYGEDAGLLVPPPPRALAPAAYYRSTMPPTPVLLHVGGESTALELPLVSRGPEAFFEAPTEST